MSSNDPKYPLVAVGFQLGYNDGANKGFWRVQPRQKLGEDKGQWIKMGAELRLYYKNLKGLIDSVPGIALGSDGTPNGVRVLIQGQEAKGFMDGIFGFDVNNVRVAEGLLSDEYLKSQGIEAGVPSDVNPDLLPNIADIPRADITPDDIRLANEGIESPEGKENEEFKNTPEGQEIARLEEAETVSSEELKKIVEPTTARAEKPKAYGMGNLQDFRDLPDGTILDEYERAQFYPSPKDYRGANGPVWRSIIKQDGKWFNVGKNGKATGKPLTSAQLKDKLDSNSLADRGAGFKFDENGDKVPAWADEVISDPAKQDAAEPEMSDEEYARAMDALDNLGVRGPRGVTGGPATNARRDLDALISNQSLRELAEDIYYNRENTSKQGDLSAAFQSDDPASFAYGDDGQDPSWNEAYNKTWDEAVKKIFSDPKVVAATRDLPVGSDDGGEPDPDLLDEALNDLAADLGAAATKALLPVAPPKEKAKPAAKAKTANDLTPDALAALKEKNTLPQDDSTLRGLRGETISNIVNDAYDKDEKTINRTLKKLHGFLGKSGTDPIGTPATIERLSNIVEAIGGTPYTPPAPKKEEDKFPERGKQNIEDYKVGDNVNVYDDSYFGDETYVNMGKVVEVTKNSAGVPVLKVKLDDDVDPNRTWDIEQKDLSPADRADNLAKAAIEQAMAGNAPSADAVIKKLNAPRVGGDDDFDFFDDEDEEETPAVTPTPEPEVVTPTPEPTPEPEVVTPTPKPETKPESKKTEPVDTKEPILPADEVIVPEATKAPNRVVDKIDPASLDQFATPESYEKYFGFVPSKEQTRFLNAVIFAKQSTAVRAGAGAGKTTSMVGLTKAMMELFPEARIALLQFNRENADEAAALVPKNTIANTTDAYFGTTHLNSLGDTMRARYALGVPPSEQWKYVISPKQFSEYFAIEDTYINGENADPTSVSALVQKAVSRFSYSIDDEIGIQHFNFAAFGDGGNDNLRPDTVEKLLKYANAYWKDITSKPEWAQVKRKDGTIGKGVVAGKTLIHPEHAIKMWALSRPDLSKLRSVDNKPITHLFLDEAQDTNAVLEKVINDNIDAGTAPLIVMVGDRSQTIYRFRGTADAITSFAEGRAGAVTGLTTTRRFGEDIARVANGFLNLIGEDYRLKSEIEGGEFFDTTNLDEIPDGIGKTTVLTRTNAEAFTQMAKYLAEGRVVGVDEKVKDELDKAIVHLKWLLEDFSTRTKLPEKGSPDFSGMYSRKDLQLAAKIDPQSRAAYWERLLSFSSSPEEAIKGLRDIADQLVVERDVVKVESITNLDASPGNSGSFSQMSWRIEGDTLILKDEVKNAVFKTPAGYDKTFRQLVIGDKQGRGPSAKKIPPIIKFADGSTPEWRAKLVNGEWESQILITSDADRTDYLNTIAGLFAVNTEEKPEIDVRISTAHRFKGKEDDNIIIGDDFAQPKLDENGNLILPNEDELNLAYTAATRPKKRINLGSLAYGQDYLDRSGAVKANVAMGRDPEFNLDIVDQAIKDQEEIRKKRQAKKSTALKTLTSTNYNGDFYFSDDETDEPEITSTSLKAPSGGKKFTDDWGVTQKGFSKRIDGTTWNITENKDGSVVVRPRTNEDRVAARKYSNLKEAAKDFPEFQKAARTANVDKLIETVAPLDTDGSISKVIKENGAPEDILKAIVSSERYGEAVDNGEINFLSLYAALDNAGTSGLTRPKTRKPKNPAPAKFVDTTEQAVDLYKNNPDAQDDGSDVDVMETGGQLIRDTKTKGDIQGQLEKLMQYGGKVQPDGSVVMFRRAFNEQTGPAAGKVRVLEVRAVGNRSASATVIWKITDPDSDEVIGEFYDRDTSDSFQALLGIMNKKLASGFMRDIEANPYSEKPNRNFEIIRDKSGIEGSIRYFNKGNYYNILNDKKASTSTLKLQTPEEHARLQLNGRDLRLNGSAEKWFIANNKGVESIYDAIDKNEMQAAAVLFQQYLLNIPDTKAAHDVAKKVLRQGMQRKFPNMDSRKLESILDDMSDKVDSSLPKPGTVIRPHVDRNGAPVVEGSIVRWENNIGQFVQGKVGELIGYENPDGGAYTYADYALVYFDGREKPVNLNTQNMEVLSNGTDDDVTPYAAWVEKDDLKIERAQFYGYTYDPRTGLITDKGGTVIDGVSLDGPTNRFSTNTMKKPVKDLQPGDAIYDDEGNLYGKVKQVKIGKNKEGQEVVGVRLEDSDKPLFFDPEEDTNVEVPKGFDRRRQDETPGPLTPAAERARALGLNFSADGKPSKKKISRNPNKKDPETTSKIKGSKKVAVKPTPEARAIKDEVLEIGSDLQRQAEVRLAEKLRERGVEIDPNNPFEDQTTAALSEASKKTFADLRIANAAMNDFELENQVDLESEEYKALFDAMVADGFASKTSVNKKALADALRESGLDLLSYLIKPQDPKKGKSAYLAYAYKTLKSENLSEAVDVYKNYEERKKADEDAKENLYRENSLIRDLQAEATLEVLKENGVKFDSVSYNDFEGRILTVKGGYALRPNSTFKSAVALQEAFDRMPESTIRRLADHLKSTGKKLYVQAGVKRGSFASTSDGNYRLSLSASRGVSGINKHTDTALHELQHFLEEVDGNVRTIGHAWAYDRLVSNPGTDKETLPNIVSIAPGEFSFALKGFAEPYMLKSYEKGDFFLTPNSVGSEVTSVLMQDMFTKPGFASNAGGQYVVSWSMKPIERGPNKGQLRKSFKVDRDAYYDEETDSWYRDEKKTDKIENVVEFYGRAKRDGLDRDVKNLGMGLIMMMNDWSPTEGLGPGNAVVEKD